jgi:hypothetical protein
MFKDAVVARENAANEFAKYEDKVYRYVISSRFVCLKQQLNKKNSITENVKNVKFVWRQRKKKLNRRSNKLKELIVVL